MTTEGEGESESEKDVQSAHHETVAAVNFARIASWLSKKKKRKEEDNNQGAEDGAEAEAETNNERESTEK